MKTFGGITGSIGNAYTNRTGIVKNCYSSTNPTGKTPIGALVGVLSKGSLQNSYFCSGLGNGYGKLDSSGKCTNCSNFSNKTLEEKINLLGAMFTIPNNGDNDNLPILKWELEN